MQKIRINKKGLRWHRSGHPWVYRDDCIDNKVMDLSGKIVGVFSENNDFLGQAFYNTNSKIILRFITRSDEPIDKNFWRERIVSSFRYRKSVVSDSNAFRVIFSESDLVPGLILDNYNDHFVMQTLTLGADHLVDEFSQIIMEEFNPKSIIIRNDASIRKLEGALEEKKIVFGQNPGLVEVFEGDIRYLVDLWEGHKTGSYLDQRENRIYLGNFEGQRALDVFSYQGGFSLHLSRHFKEVVSIESSRAATEVFDKNIELNGIKNIKIVNANGFDTIKEYSNSKEKFDLIILDPPAFAKAKKDVGGAERGYKELNLRAIKLLNDNGILVACSCSYNIKEEDFINMAKDAGVDAKRNLYLVEKRIQSLDHPILVSFPESFYLKCLVFRVVD